MTGSTASSKQDESTMSQRLANIDCIECASVRVVTLSAIALYTAYSLKYPQVQNTGWQKKAYIAVGATIITGMINIFLSQRKSINN